MDSQKYRLSILAFKLVSFFYIQRNILYVVDTAFLKKELNKYTAIYRETGSLCFTGPVKADSHIACRSPAMPCR